MIESIEGRRGEPRFKPPCPGVSGLYGKPTVVNNVKTLANVPVILEKGGAWFSGIGVPNCTGTKVFTLCGNITQKGVFEYPMGTNLRDIYRLDKELPLRKSHDNPAVKALYENCLGEPGSHRSHEMLHTGYSNRSSLLG